MPTVEELESQLQEKDTALAEANTKLTGYTEKLGKVEDLESFLTLKTDRDNLKKEVAKVKNLEAEIATLKKGNKGNQDEDKAKLLEDKEKELEALSEKLTLAETKAAEKDALEAEIVKELTDQLPKEHKEIVEGMLIPKLRAYVKLHGVKDPAKVDGGNASGEEVKLTAEQKKEAETLGLSDKLYLEVIESRKKKDNK